MRRRAATPKQHSVGRIGCGRSSTTCSPSRAPATASVVRSLSALDLVASAAIADLEVDIVEAGAKVDVAPLATVEGNPTQLRQLVQNLLANALKFRRGERTPVVTVTCDDDDRGCIVSVADNGVGIEPERRRSVFEMFARGAGDAAGLGIGLAVCARVIEGHHGRIWIDDNEEGGATVRFWLPYRQPAASESA